MLFYFLTILISVECAPSIFDKNRTLSTPAHQVDEEIHGNSNSKNLSKRSSLNQDVDLFGDGNFFENNFESLKSSYQRDGFNPTLWNHQTIPYAIDSSIGESDRRVIYDAIRDFHNKTCLKFRKRNRLDVNYVHFINRKVGCWAHMGRIGGNQKINLGPKCYTKGIVLHEMMHAIGFNHEHVRPNRDEYITVNFDEIPEERKIMFRKQTREYSYNEGFPYDLCSLMHYRAPRWIVPKVDSKCFAQRFEFSDIDLRRIHKMYRCNQHEKLLH